MFNCLVQMVVSPVWVSIFCHAEIKYCGVDLWDFNVRKILCVVRFFLMVLSDRDLEISFNVFSCVEPVVFFALFFSMHDAERIFLHLF